MLIYHAQAGIIQQGGEKEILLIFTIDLEDHDPLLIIADDGGVDLIIGGKPYLGSVELHGLSYRFRHPVQLYCRAMNDAPVLVLEDHVEVIRVGYEVHIDILVRHEGERYPLEQLHTGIVDANGIIRVIILENQEVTVDLADDLEVGTAAVFPFRLGIGYLLGVC